VSEHPSETSPRFLHKLWGLEGVSEDPRPPGADVDKWPGRMVYMARLSGDAA
jgi:hypothetical protein